MTCSSKKLVIGDAGELGAEVVDDEFGVGREEVVTQRQVQRELLTDKRPGITTTNRGGGGRRTGTRGSRSGRLLRIRLHCPVNY
jgi:hypothetical protein